MFVLARTPGLSLSLRGEDDVLGGIHLLAPTLRRPSLVDEGAREGARESMERLADDALNWSVKVLDERDGMRYEVPVASAGDEGAK